MIIYTFTDYTVYLSEWWDLVLCGGGILWLLELSLQIH